MQTFQGALVMTESKRIECDVEVPSRAGRLNDAVG